jgi:hypothetical protein
MRETFLSAWPLHLDPRRALLKGHSRTLAHPAVVRLGRLVSLSGLPSHRGRVTHEAKKSSTIPVAVFVVAPAHPVAVDPLVGEARERQRRRRRRFAMTVVLAAVVALTLAGHQWGAPFGGAGSSRGSLAHYHDYALSFSYPASWHTAPGWAATMGQMAVVYLSTERLHSPCKVFHHANGDVTGSQCGSPLVLADKLSSGGVLVSWTGHFAPGGGFSQLTGTRTRIDGHPARIVPNQADCPWDANKSLTVDVAANESGPSGWYQMDACMRGPQVAQVEAQVQAMLRSFRFATPTR